MSIYQIRQHRYSSNVQIDALFGLHGELHGEFDMV